MLIFRRNWMDKRIWCWNTTVIYSGRDTGQQNWVGIKLKAIWKSHTLYMNTYNNIIEFKCNNIFYRVILLFIVLMTIVGSLYDIYKKEENQSGFSEFSS